MSAGRRVEVEGLSKAFPGVVALQDVSASFGAGRVHALLGANGAGKSTLMNVLAGRIRQDAGTVRLDGEVVEHTGPLDAQRHGVELIPQEVTLVPGFTVAENIVLGAYPASASRVRWGAVRRRAVELADRLGVAASPDTPVREVSAVDQRLVMIARALHREGAVVMMDEPTAALPHSQAKRLFSVIDDLRAQGLTVLYCSHRLEDVLEVCDDVTVMRSGRVILSRLVEGLSRADLVASITGQSERATRAARGAAVSGEVVLEAEGLCGVKIQDATLTLRRGEILGVAGLVGSGSSELTRLLFGAQPLTAGTVRVGGRAVRLRSPRDAIRAGVGLLPQERRVQGSIVGLSIADNLTLARPRKAARGFMLDRRAERRLAADVIERYDIQRADPERPLGQLSGGNQQRVLMAKWLFTDVDVLLLDEPTVGIDVGARAGIHEMLRDMTAAGGAVLVASSDFEELGAIADRAIVLREGRIVGELHRPDVTPAEILHYCYEDRGAAA